MPDAITPGGAAAPSMPSTPSASPSGGGAAEPAAVQAGGAAEPRAAEPVAAAPASEPTPTAYPTPDAFEWDTWDGKPEVLPEQVRPWHEGFAKRFETDRLKYQDDLARSNSNAALWKRLYESHGMGAEDPRVSELSTKVQSYESAFQRYQEEQAQQMDEIRQEFEKSTADYYDLVVRQNKDFFAGLTPQVRMALEEAVEHLPLHVAVEYATLGEGVLKDAMALAAKGADPEVIERIIQAERTSSKAGVPPRQPSQAASLVAGSDPARTPPRVPSNQLPAPTNHTERLMAAAKKAIALQRAQGGRSA